MGALTDDGEVLGLKFLTAQGGTVSAIYVALCTAAPDDASPGTAVSGGSYARQSASFSVPSSGSCSNSADLVFTGMPTATVSHIELYTALTGGTRVWYGPLASSKAVSSGDTFTIPSGSLVLSLD